jgi:unsaturated chondroitin disaccharide hydrolase
MKHSNHNLSSDALSEMQHALSAMLKRMPAIHAQCAGAFPLYSLACDDRWQVSKGGAWVGGFWVASWWLRSQLMRSASDQQQAARLRQALADKVHSATLNRSMLFWYGAGLTAGEGTHLDQQASQLAKDAAAALVTSFDTRLQCFPLGVEMGGGSGGNERISVDTLAPLLRLLHFAQPSHYRRLAQQHLATLMDCFLTSNGAIHSEAHLVDGKFTPSGQAGNWSRGQAWAMLGLASAASIWHGQADTPQDYLGMARLSCEYWRKTRGEESLQGDGMPRDQLIDQLSDQIGDLYDPSAAVIAALAMITLIPLLSNAEERADYLHCAQTHILRVLRSRYFVLRDDGSALFWGACYQTRPAQREMVESVWSNFLLQQALCLLTGAIP